MYINANPVPNAKYALIDFKTCVKETSELGTPFNITQLYWYHGSPWSNYTGIGMGAMMDEKVADQSAERHQTDGYAQVAELETGLKWQPVKSKQLHNLVGQAKAS